MAITIEIAPDSGAFRATLGEHTSLGGDPIDAAIATLAKAREAGYKVDGPAPAPAIPATVAAKAEPAPAAPTTPK